jgi:hypothetical protein
LPVRLSDRSDESLLITNEDISVTDLTNVPVTELFWELQQRGIPCVMWRPADVISAKFCDYGDPDPGDFSNFEGMLARAEAELRRIGAQIEDRMTERGWEVIETLISDDAICDGRNDE